MSFLKFLSFFTALVFSLYTNAQSDSLKHDGLMRYYLVHLPINYNPDKAYPLVVAMHGGVGSGPQLENQSQLSESADENDFIVVYPDGVKNPIGIRTWNAGVCCGYAASQNIDDVGFIEKLIDTLENKYPIAVDKRFATGMSNGGFMAYRLACEKPDLLAAIAPVACTSTAACSPNKWVPTIHFHSYVDSNIPYQGGRGDGLSNHYNPPLDSIRQLWSNASHCKEKDSTIDKGNFDMFRHKDCDCDAEYILYLSYDGGHSWPGGKKSAIGDTVSTHVFANQWMWDFFEKHPKCEMTLGEQKGVQLIQVNLYPNPTQNILNLTSEQPIKSIRLYDSKGRMLKVISIQMSLQSQIDVQDLPSGYYYLSIFTANQHVHKTFLKTSLN